MSMTIPELSIILPAYNEADAISSALEAALAYVHKHGNEAEIIVVDDGSTDATRELAESFAGKHPCIRVISYAPNRGKGFAVKEGMLAARGKYRMFLDVDLATPFSETDRLLEALARGAEVVVGSRHLPTSQIELPQRPVRRLMGSVFRHFTRWLLRLPATDFTCGFKGFQAEAAERLFGNLTELGWAFDAELILMAYHWGMRVEEVPVRWRDVRRSAGAPLRAARESFAAWLRSPRTDRRGLYGST
ncbi:MAG: dolichyl-phosphate beta-glucosyltransferase, partial [Candidatus Zipacnadales bacterium]